MDGLQDETRRGTAAGAAGRDAPTTIWTDAGWALPAGTSGIQTFYQCS